MITQKVFVIIVAKFVDSFVIVSDFAIIQDITESNYFLMKTLSVGINLKMLPCY